MNVENSLILAKDRSLQIREAEKSSRSFNPKKLLPKHTLIKLLKIKDKEETLKVAREKSCIIYGEDRFKSEHISHLKP